MVLLSIIKIKLNFYEYFIINTNNCYKILIISIYLVFKLQYLKLFNRY